MAENRENAAPRLKTTGKPRGPGRKFLPGNSANPGGRPKIPDRLREMGPEALERLYGIMLQDDNVVEARHAATWIAEKVYGKPAAEVVARAENPAAAALVALALGVAPVLGDTEE